MNANESDSFDNWTNRMAAVFPELWKMLYSKVYDSIGQYGSPRLPAVTVLTTALSGFREHSHMVIYTQACQALASGSQTYFITRDLVASLSKMTLPDDFCFSDFKLKWPCVTFMLPKGMNLSPDGRDCPYLRLSFQEANTNYSIPLKTKIGQLPIIHNQSSALVISTSTYITKGPDGGMITYHFTVPGDAKNLKEVMALNESPNSVEERERELQIVENNMDEFNKNFTNRPLSTGEGDFAKQCLLLAIKIALFMETKPEYVELGSPKKKFHPSKERTDIYYPNIVGKSYRIRYVYANGQEIPESERRHVRLHYRIPHMRWQPYGPRKTVDPRDRKRVLIHIDGMMVGGKDEEKT
jgi:hypothetical protein